jgi:MFS transporter, DHA2 family, multidrug resistance protein
VAFIVHELRSAAPVVNLRVFKVGTYRTGVMLMSMLGFVLYGSIVMLPIMLQTVLGYTALDAGFATAPRGLGAFLAMPLIGMVMARFDPRKLLSMGVVFAGTALFLLAQLNLNAGYWNIFWPQILQGTAAGLIWVPLTTITMDPIPNEQMGNATSIFNLTRNLGASIGISTATTLLARRQQFHLNVLGARVNEYSFSTQLTLERTRAMLEHAGSDFFTASRQSYGLVSGLVARQAAMISFLDIFWLLGLIFELMLPLVWLMKRPTQRKRP